MDMSEDSNNNESDRELPQAEPEPPRRQCSGRGAWDRTNSEGDRWDRDNTPPRSRSDRNSRESPERRDKGHDSHRRDERDGRDKYDRDRNRSPRREDKNKDKHRSERSRLGEGSSASSSSSSGRRGLLGDTPDERASQESSSKVPALMDLKPFGGEPPPALRTPDSRDGKDARSGERDRDRRDRDRDRERERDKDRERDRGKDRERDRGKDRYARRSEERKSSSRRAERRSRSRSRERHGSSRDRSDRSRDRSVRSRSRGDTKPHAPSHTLQETHSYAPPSHAPRGHGAEQRSGLGGSPPPGPDYRPSYKVSKKLQVMEKMGLQIKTPDGSMATAQQLMQRTVAEQHRPAAGAAAPLPSYYNPNAVNATKLVNQVQKRKLLWGNKSKEGEEAAPSAAPAVKWTATKFAQDTDGKVASKFMRLMGIKDPEAVKPAETENKVDLNKQQEEMFQAMQAQYDVARVTTHTMRGVGLGFQRQY